jgi:hypothetical protein
MSRMFILDLIGDSGTHNPLNYNYGLVPIFFGQNCMCYTKVINCVAFVLHSILSFRKRNGIIVRLILNIGARWK